MTDPIAFQLMNINKTLKSINHDLVKTNTLLYELVRLQIKAETRKLAEEDADA